MDGSKWRELLAGKRYKFYSDKLDTFSTRNSENNGLIHFINVVYVFMEIMKCLYSNMYEELRKELFRPLREL